jgi:PAS domain S-box-containing protein
VLRPLTESLDDELAWALLEDAPDGIVLADESGRILLVNRRTEELFGYERGELLGRPVEQLVPEPRRGTHRAHRARYRAEPHPRAMGAGLELRGRRADGTEFPVEISLSPVRREGTLRIVATVRDITERLRSEARQQAAEQQLRLVEDRERLARDLHDVVIQRLFATGMAAQSLQARIDDPALAARAVAIVDDLDQTIREIRTAIFALQKPADAARTGLRGAILDVVDAERPALGFVPHVVFDGVIDETSDATAQQLLAILRESLSNAARHSDARTVEIEVRAEGPTVTLRVGDDGRGMPAEAAASGNGLRNMAARAESVGGVCTVSPRAGGGTEVECRLPLAAEG